MNIKIGAAVLSYLSEIISAKEDILSAWETAENCKTIASDEETYKGAAKDEIDGYFDSLVTNLQQLYFLYDAAEKYVESTYTTMYYNEAQLSAWLMEQMEDK